MEEKERRYQEKGEERERRHQEKGEETGRRYQEKGEEKEKRHHEKERADPGHLAADTAKLSLAASDSAAADTGAAEVSCTAALRVCNIFSF